MADILETFNHFILTNCNKSFLLFLFSSSSSDKYNIRNVNILIISVVKFIGKEEKKYLIGSIQIDEIIITWPILENSNLFTGITLMKT